MSYLSNPSSSVVGGGITSLNGLTVTTQIFSSGTAGSIPNVSSSGAIHTINIPVMASTGVTQGVITNAAQTLPGLKTFPDGIITSLTLGNLLVGNASNVSTVLAIGTAGQVLTVVGGTAVWQTFAGAGTVTNVSSANADATITNPTTTPIITIVQTPALRSATTTVNVSASTAPTVGQVLTATGPSAATWQTLVGTGDMLLAGAQINTGLKTFLDATLGFRNVANTFTSLFTNTNTAARTYTLPDVTGTVTVLGNASTGSGAVVLATSPTLITPALGTPSALVLTNATGLPLTGLVASTSLAIGVGSIELGNATDTTISRVSAGQIAVESIVVPTVSSINTLTNKRVQKRVVATTQSATPAINTDNGDIFEIVGLAQAITSMTSGLTGTPLEGEMVQFIFKDNGTARAITWGAGFVSSTVALPIITAANTSIAVLLQYRTSSVWTAASAWNCIAVA